MELFPAADDDSLTLIKNVIDDSDYYLIIPGGRYGTIDESTGKSYTELEYEYALETGKPIVALVHSSSKSLPAEKTERTDEGQRRFQEFSAALKKRHVRFGKTGRSLLPPFSRASKTLRRPPSGRMDPRRCNFG
jgi:hypothetical protein